MISAVLGKEYVIDGHHVVAAQNIGTICGGCVFRGKGIEGGCGNEHANHVFCDAYVFVPANSPEAERARIDGVTRRLAEDV